MPLIVALNKIKRIRFKILMNNGFTLQKYTLTLGNL